MRRIFACAAVLGAAFAAAKLPLLAQAQTLSISAIQGPGPRSPVEGHLVVTSGVITGRKTNGVFIQSPDGSTDADPRTSEGLFIFTGTAPAATLTVGTMVSVTGRVIEFVPPGDPLSPAFTEIGESPSIDVRGSGAALPAPIEIREGDISPNGGHDQLERLEGMRVRIASLRTVSGTLGTVNEPAATASSSGVFYGVVSGSRPRREPGVNVFEPLPPGAPCCVPRFDGNPERIRVDSDGQPGARALDVASGTIVLNLVGPLDYGFRSYTILPDAATPPALAAGGPGAAPAGPASDDELSVASVNLQRFFDTSNDPTTSDAVLTAAAFQARLAKASLYILGLLGRPDVVALSEVENLATLQTLAAVLNRDARLGGLDDPQYEAYLEEGNDPGGIDVGALVKRARVEVLEYRQEGKPLTFTNPLGQEELLNDRPPLLLGVRVTNQRNAQLRVTILINHLRSMIDIESATTGPRVRAKRAAQAEFVAGLVNRRLSDDPHERFLLVGDFNAFEFNDGYVDVIGTIRGTPAAREQVILETDDLVDPDLTNLIDALPPQERYSYVFDGTAQALDHMLASEALLPQVSGFSYIRGNADSPEVWRSDARRPERLSDHDAALVYLRLAR
jgi:predicted extracellular nuclease